MGCHFPSAPKRTLHKSEAGRSDQSVMHTQMNSYIYIYIYIYIHIHIPTCTYMQAYVNTYIRALRTYVLRTYVLTYILPFLKDRVRCGACAAAATPANHREACEEVRSQRISDGRLVLFGKHTTTVVRQSVRRSRHSPERSRIRISQSTRSPKTCLKAHESRRARGRASTATAACAK